MVNAMTYLVLRSNSFAGATLVKHLLNKEANVIGVSRSQQPSDTLGTAPKVLTMSKFLLSHINDVIRDLKNKKIVRALVSISLGIFNLH